MNRNNFLTSLSDKYSSKLRLPTMDLRRNVRVDYYLNKYEQIQDKVEKGEIKNNCYLNSTVLPTVSMREDKGIDRNWNNKD